MPESGLDFLLRRINYERRAVLPYGPDRMKLANMRELLRRLGNPDDDYPIIHVAGTKGKGSVTTMLASVLAASGYKTGTYTSPHLSDLCERFCINGRQCRREVLDELIAAVRPHVLAMDQLADRNQPPADGHDFDRPTFFEITTAIAFLFFSLQKVDFAVIETGLGGRLDSTNVCSPVLSVITSISFDHTKQLGNTLGEIAFEKAGIIKPGVPVVSGVLESEPREVIRHVAQKHASPLIEMGTGFRTIDSDANGKEASASTLKFKLPDVAAFDFESDAAPGNPNNGPLRIEQILCSLPGSHQQRNAAVATAACLQLSTRFPAITNATIRQGIGAATMPGRIELLSGDPPVILDVAHNVASAQALIDTIGDSIGGLDSTLIYATSRDKDFEGCLKVLLPHFRRIYFTRFLENPRARSPRELLKMARTIVAGHQGEDTSSNSAMPREFRSFENPIDAWQAARSNATQRGVICITGSAFIVAELRNVCTTSLT